jgi:hypothetical protein
MSAAPDEPWPYSPDELYAMCHATGGVRTDDGAKLVYWAARSGDPAIVDRARARATEIIEATVDEGTLALLAGELERRHYLSGRDVAEILRSPEPGSTPASVDPERTRSG